MFKKNIDFSLRSQFQFNQKIFQAPSLEDHVDYHFIAFVEKDGILYDLDGRKPAPVDCGPTTKETFLKVNCLFFQSPVRQNLMIKTEYWLRETES